MARSLEWMDKALCAQIDPDVWFPDNSAYSQAKSICARCPVQQACVDHAQTLEGTVAHRYRYGAWGGTTPHPRAKQAKQTARQARHAEILRLTAAGWDPPAIADHLDISDRTVWRVLEARRNTLEEAA